MPINHSHTNFQCFCYMQVPDHIYSRKHDRCSIWLHISEVSPHRHHVQYYITISEWAAYLWQLSGINNSRKLVAHCISYVSAQSQLLLCYMSIVQKHEQVIMNYVVNMTCVSNIQTWGMETAFVSRTWDVTNTCICYTNILVPCTHQ